MFLDGKIHYLDIIPLNEACCEAHKADWMPNPSLEDIVAADAEARRWVKEQVRAGARAGAGVGGAEADVGREGASGTCVGRLVVWGRANVCWRNVRGCVTAEACVGAEWWRRKSAAGGVVWHVSTRVQ